MYNKAILIGRLGRDPEIKRNDNDFPMCQLSIATDRRWKDKQSGENKEETTWIPVKLLGKTAENAGKYLRKGSLIAVEGRIQIQKYEKDGETRVFTSVLAERVNYLAKWGKDGDGDGGGESAPASTSTSSGSQDDFEDQDIPF